MSDSLLDKVKISTRLIAEEALRRGYTVDYLPGGKSKTGVLIINDGHATYVLKSTVGTLSKAYGVFVATNKYLMGQLLQKFNLPVPETVLYNGGDLPLDFLADKKSVAVKPLDTNHGVGVSTSVMTADDLAGAILRAQKAAKSTAVLVQEMATGIDHRLLVVGDKLVAAAYRKPAVIIGDGEHTIAELIFEENNNPLRGEGHSKPLTLLDLDLITKYISKKGFSQADVLEKGKVLELSGVANLSQGGMAIDVTDSVHPSVAAIAVKATKVAGLGVCGVDIMCADISKDAAESNPKIIELNESPGIRMHHFPSEGTPRDVASAILDQAIASGGLMI